MTNDELEHHLGTAFKLIREQAELIRAIKGLIDNNNAVASKADQIQEAEINSLKRTVEEIEARLGRIENSDFEEVRH